MAQEAMLRRCFLVSFNSEWQFLSSEELPSLPSDAMRPTAVLLNAQSAADKKLVMMGGYENGSSQAYSFA